MATAPARVAVTQAPLRIASSRPWFSLRLRELWTYRELLYFFVWRDVKIRYKQTAIGAAWAVLQPLLTMLVFSLFFGRLAKLPSNGLPYPIFYYCALLPWSYFATALQNATNVVVEQQRLITKIYFPRLVLPVSAVLSGLVDFAVAFGLLIILMLYYHIAPGRAVLLLPGFLLLALVTALAFGSECDLPGRALRRPFSYPALDVCFSGGLFDFARSAELALDLWPESHGWRHRGISLVAYSSGAPAWTVICRVGLRSGACSGWRALLFPQNGRHGCRYRLNGQAVGR